MARLTELLTGSSKQNLLSTIDRGDVIRLAVIYVKEGSAYVL